MPHLPNTSLQHTFVDSRWVFERYESVRARLPVHRLNPPTREVADLAEIADQVDVFLFDSFGVLNVGDSAIPTAVERIAQLRALGKRLFVLTNAASVPLAETEAKYLKLGFDFRAEEIVSSRAVLAAALHRLGEDKSWRVIAPYTAKAEELPGRILHYQDHEPLDCQGLVFLSGSGWSEARQALLLEKLQERPLPVLVGNPDIAAPREEGFSMEPGAYAHELADRLGLTPQFFGKPFANAFDLVSAQLGKPLSEMRALMVGDTLHTDILGGAAAGISTLLVTDHGMLKDMDVSGAIAASGIAPSFLAPAI